MRERDLGRRETWIRRVTRVGGRPRLRRPGQERDLGGRETWVGGRPCWEGDQGGRETCIGQVGGS
jgi:hypothetical protein